MKDSYKLKEFLNSPSKVEKYEANSNIKIGKADRVLRTISGMLPNDLYVKQSGIDRWQDAERKAVTGENIFHSLHYVARGEGVLECNGKKYKIGEHTLFVVFSDVDACYYANPKNPWTYIYLDIGGILQSSIIKKLGFNNMNCVFKLRKNNSLEDKFYKVHESALETGAHSLKTLSELYGLFALLEEVRFGSKVSNLQERYVREALTYIENNVATADVKSTAEDCAISATYLTRVCKNILGLSLKDLITLTRLQVACNYLRYTRKPIKEVGAQVGYPQRKYFTRVFKSVFDVTPTQYRENN